MSNHGMSDHMKNMEKKFLKISSCNSKQVEERI